LRQGARERAEREADHGEVVAVDPLDQPEAT
jgi:hypothetical protein